MDNTYACYVYWREIDVNDQGFREFIIMWSDHTWESIEIPNCDWNLLGGASFKRVMNLNKVISNKMNKGEAKKYIQERIKKIEELMD